MDAEYYVVVFDKFIAVVTTKWVDLDKKLVYWPKKKAITKKNITTLVPDDTWSQFNLKKYFGPYDTYEAAKNIEKKGLYFSTSDDSDAVLQTVTSNDIRQKKRQHDCCSESVSGDNESDGSFDKENIPKKKMNRLPSPPTHMKNVDKSPDLQLNPLPQSMPIQNAKDLDDLLAQEDEETWMNNPYIIRNLNIVNEINNRSSNEVTDMIMRSQVISDARIIQEPKANLHVNPPESDEENNERINADTPETVQSTDGIRKTNIVVKSNEKVNFAIMRQQNKLAIDKKKQAGPTAATFVVDSHVSNAGPSAVTPITHPSVPDGPLTEKRYLVYHQQILRKLNKIEKMSKRVFTVEEEDTHNILPEFPITSLETLEEFEKLLTDSADVKAAYIKYIKSVGGNNEGDSTRNALRAVMTDAVAKQFSWSGQRNTKKIKDMLICIILLDAVVATSKNYTLNKCKDYAKIWVQHAKERFIKKGQNHYI